MGPRNSIIFDKKNLFCNVDPTAVIESIDASSIYQVPMLMKQEKLDEVVLKKLKITVYPKPNLESWEEFLYKLKNPEKEVTIGLVGKYVELKDAYKNEKDTREIIDLAKKLEGKTPCFSVFV